MIAIQELWTPAGIVLGFQMTLFSWRLSEEARVGADGETPWLAPSDYMNLSGAVVILFSTFLLPAAQLISPKASYIFFGLGTMLFLGSVFSMAGHYQLYRIRGRRMCIWFPKQEKIAMLCSLIASLAYLIVALQR